MAEAVTIEIARQEVYADDLQPREPSVSNSSLEPELEVPPAFATKADVSTLAQEIIGERVGRKLGDQEIEIINTLVDMGDNDTFIARLLGRGKTTIARHRSQYETSLSFDEGDEERSGNRNKFIKKAYDLAFALIDELIKPERLEGAKFDKIATTLGIVMDKVLLASARFESSGSQESGFLQQFKGMNDTALNKFAGSVEKILSISNGRQANKNDSRQSETSAEGSES